MHVSDETRATHAALVPVYVRAAGEAWELVDTASDEALSTHETPRQAMIAALKIDNVAALNKRANLREDGEPIGAWRWLDASAEEDEPVHGSRITAESIWEMAASLNGRKSAIPINGGGAPRAGLGDSAPHGDAYTGGDHLANGYAHLAVPTLDETGRTHLFLRSELLPEIAAEVDLGRLAYGSIRFGFDEVDEADDFAVKGAVLISHALTNDPAVTTLTAGSERRRGNEPVHVACRSRRSSFMSKPNKSQRGPASEILSKLAEMLGISPEQLTEDPWSLTDAIYALQSAEKVEEIIEAAGEVPAEPSGDSAEMQARAVLRGVVRAAKIAKREVEGVEPEEVDPMLESFVELAGEVLDKPDAEPAELLAELEARKAEIADALGNDAPEADPATEPADDPDEEREEGDEDEDEREKDKDKPGADKDPEMFAKPGSDDEDDKFAKKSAREMRTIAASLRKRAEKAEGELKAEREKVAKLETAAWLDEAITARQLPMPKAEREKLLKFAIEKGRDVAEAILDARNRPPATNPMYGNGAPVRHQPRSFREATDLCMAEARENAAPDTPNQLVRAAAQKLARSRWPELIENESGAA